MAHTDTTEHPPPRPNPPSIPPPCPKISNSPLPECPSATVSHPCGIQHNPICANWHRIGVQPGQAMPAQLASPAGALWHICNTQSWHREACTGLGGVVDWTVTCVNWAMLMQSSLEPLNIRLSSQSFMVKYINNETVAFISFFLF